MKPTQRRVNSQDVRDTWRTCLDEVQAGGVIIVVRNGKEIAAMVSIDLYKRLKEKAGEGKE